MTPTMDVLVATTLAALGAWSILRSKERHARVLGFMLAMCTIAGTLNATAIIANGGRMPVFDVAPHHAQEIEESRRHQLGTEETRFKILCDWIPIGEARASIGDMFIAPAALAVIAWSLIGLGRIVAMLL